MWGGLGNFTLPAFLSWLTPILSWSTLLWLIAVGLVFTLVPELFDLVVDIAKILFGMPLNPGRNMVVTVGGVSSLVSAAKYDSFLKGFGLQDIGSRTDEHTLVATDDEGTILVQGQAEFFERVKKGA